MRQSVLYTLFLFLSIFYVTGQRSDANIFGDVQSGGEHIPFANVYLEGTTIGTTTDETGHFLLIDLPAGKYTLVASTLGYSTVKTEVEIIANQTQEVNFDLQQETLSISEVVVTGTKTFKRSTESPVIVNVLDRKTLNAVQACNISEGLRFQPGLRVETDCQTCNYTQLRMNGLGGGYSQILINGRQVFSPLVGLYGLEQIPANMVERIEVVRGGGSALFGSSAIGGTVNVITVPPRTNNFDVSITANSIGGQAADYVLNGNVTMVTRKRNAGAVLFVNQRKRDAYDHSGLTLLDDGTYRRERDKFSELPALRNNSFGGNLFFKPKPNHKIELNLASLYEYRYGGEMVRERAHLAQQSEERAHNIMMGGLDYQVNFNDDKSSFIVYLAGQNTYRDHYTGAYPRAEEFDTADEFDEAELEHLKNPPYGYTYNHTLQGGMQFNQRIDNIFGTSAVVTIGADNTYDDVVDSIPSFSYGTNQQTSNAAIFVQGDWKLAHDVALLLGVRADRHNFVAHTIFSPRVSLLYRLQEYTQFRLTWGTGFRAPQAFDADMHMAFAGGGISRISLSPGLQEERSNSVSGSINFDIPTRRYVAGFTLESFYTRLNHAFYLHPVAADDIGEQFEKRNGPGALVQGGTLELRGNYNKLVQLETGITLQKSLHDEPIEVIEGLEPRRDFLRTPDIYGYGVLTITPGKRFNASLNSVYTGPMEHAKFSPDESIVPNEFRQSKAFTEINLKVGYTFPIGSIDSGIELFAGVKNLTNTFQQDFDNFKNRDSNYVYGPALPRTFYVGMRLKSL